MFKNSRSEGFGAEVKRRIILGTYVLSSGYYDACYKKAQQVRTLVKNEFKKAFNKYDILLTISIPCGVDSKNMPIGMQLIGNHFAEEIILNAAYAFEKNSH